MKNKNSISILAALALLALTTACTDDNVPTPGADGGIRFTTSISGFSATTRATMDESGKGRLADGDKFSVSIVSNASAHSYDYELGKGFSLGGKDLYWKEISDELGAMPYTFTAYYPADQENLAAFNVVTAGNPDLLVAAPVQATQPGTVDLVFHHVMHKLAVNLTKEDALTGVDLSTASVALKNLKSCAGIKDTKTGLVDEEGASNDSDPQKNIYPPKTGAATAFIVAPQDLVVGADWIEVSVSGETLIYQVPASIAGNDSSHPTRLQSGKMLTIHLAIKNAADLRSTASSSLLAGLTLECTGMESSE